MPKPKRPTWSPSDIQDWSTYSLARDGSPLYVMQNAAGLIKIGRSSRVEARRRSLERECRCPVAIVASPVGSGRNEEEIHDRLSRFRIGHEWFSGTARARRAIAEAFDVEIASWPFEYDPEAARLWREQFFAMQVAEGGKRYWRRRVRQMKGVLLGYIDPSGLRHVDSDIWINRGDDGPRMVIVKNGQLFQWTESEGQTAREVPRYTSDLALAMSLWPESSPMPEGKAAPGSPLEWCIAALCERWGIDLLRIKPEGAGDPFATWRVNRSR